ncbi:MAG: trypsin-like peptidase domain-containing protein [Alphaproteobacteria bacterium]|nr:trypsin-like peptidase domain-containing protein [Alphaproteobacteria bacterium]
MNCKKIILVFLFQFVVLTAKAQTSFAPLVEELMPMVVNISTDVEIEKDAPEVQNSLIFEEKNRENLGSGFVVDEQGYIVTNAHVIEKASKISVVTSDGKVYKAEVVGQDSKTDIALIKIKPAKSLTAVVFGNSDEAKVGDWVLAIGNPFGLGSSVSAGIISAKARDIAQNSYTNYFQTDAAINQGNSGGPMFNINGEVIGINSAIFSSSGDSVGVGFALPSNEVKRIVEELKSKGKVIRSWLGIELKKATTADGISGLVITSFTDEKLAKNNGFEIGDMILELNSNPVVSMKSFCYDISVSEPDSKVKLKIWRDGKIIEQTAKLGIMQEKVSENKKEIQIPTGEFYSELGAYFDGLKVTGFDKESVLISNGVSIGDEVVKINGNDIISVDDFNFIIKDSYLSQGSLRFDMIDANNQAYFVVLKFGN